MARYAVDADEDVFAYLWGRRRWSIGLCGVILFALSFPLFAFGWVDVGFAVVAYWGDEATCTLMRG